MPKARPVSLRPLRHLKIAARRVWMLPLLATGASAARADVYHAVSGGDTLQSVANKYRVSSQQLRLANGLKEADDSPLGAMLLRVPMADGAAATGMKSLAPLPDGFGQNTFSPPRAAFARPVARPVGSGVMSKTMSETVRQNDTWDTIAARYRAMGNDVSTDSLRRRNGWGDLPSPGETVIVPLGQVSYSAPRPLVRPSISASAQTVPRVLSPNSRSPRALGARALDGGVLASGEIDLPTVRDNTPTQSPVFGASIVSGPRRGAVLSSRGGFGQMARTAQGGQVRVLGQGEEADAPPASNQARMSSAPAPRRVDAIASVVKVSARGGSIRRLPQASAQTLYKCAVGTELAVLRRKGVWSAVLMNDSSVGWLPTKYLSAPSRTINISAQFMSSDPGGSVSRYGNNYAGENPMVANALTWLGTRYVYGGNTRRGIDCSALVKSAFASQGYRLPRTAAQQATVGVAVAPQQLKAGDRVYFSASGSRIDHTGLYMGDGLFVHASGSGRQVMVSNLFTPRNWNIYVGARR